MNQLKRLKGALLSGKRAAYLGLLIKGLQPISRFLDSSFATKQRPKSSGIKYPVLIVGAPRSGTTILYQYLCMQLKCVYLSNWHTLLPRTASRFFKKPKTFLPRNFYGHTPRLNDASEANDFFSYILKSSDPTEVRWRFNHLTAYLDDNSPIFIMKNTAAFDKIALLADAMPEMKFIFINRNLAQNVQSELKAFYELGNFNPIPESMKSMDWNDSPARFCADQIIRINAEIKDQLHTLESDRHISLTYEDFCSNPKANVQQIIRDILDNDLTLIERELTEIKLHASNSQKVNDKDLAIILQRIHEKNENG